MPKRSRDHQTKMKEADDISCDEKQEFCNDRKDEQRTAANRRERLRMRVLSKAFGKLKTTLPWVPVDTKLSKLDTLRLASSYIGHLNKILVSEDGISRMTFCPENLSWPLLFDSRAMEGLIRKGQCSPDSAEGQSS